MHDTVSENYLKKNYVQSIFFSKGKSCMEVELSLVSMKKPKLRS